MIDREAVLEMMNESEAVYLGTVSDGTPRVRALVNLRRRDVCPRARDFCRTGGFVSYFATSLASAKVSEIRASPSVAVYFSNPGRTRGVEVRGHMEVLTDPGIKQVLWHDEWRIYWHGADDPDYVVLRLEPTDAVGWWGSAPFRLELRGA